MKYLKKLDWYALNIIQLKSQISRYIKKQLPPDISKFNEIPDESEYYINERDENFMVFKNSNIIIFQSSFPISNRIVY